MERDAERTMNQVLKAGEQAKLDLIKSHEKEVLALTSHYNKDVAEHTSENSKFLREKDEEIKRLRKDVQDITSRYEERAEILNENAILIQKYETRIVQMDKDAHVLKRSDELHAKAEQELTRGHAEEVRKYSFELDQLRTLGVEKDKEIQ